MATIIRSPTLSQERRTLAVSQTAPSVVHDDQMMSDAAQPQDGNAGIETTSERPIASDLPSSRNPEEAFRIEYEARLKEEVETHRREAKRLYEQASEEGYRTGLIRGEEEARAKSSEVTARLNSILDKVDQLFAGVESLIEDAALEVVCEALFKVIGERLLTTEGIKSHMRNALARVRDEERIVIRLHPVDLELIQRFETSMTDRAGANISWLPDESLVYGGCVVETQGGSIDARIDNQLQRLAATLLAARRSSGTNRT